MQPLEEGIVEFLRAQNCLIVEPSSTFSSTIQACLQTLGVRAEQIFIARKYEDARRMIRQLKPKVLVTEYDMGTGLGFGLIDDQQGHYGESDRISIIVTKNSSDSAIAEAADEQVDAYLRKPFSAESFRERLLAVFSAKVNPSPYVLRIRQGKSSFDRKDYARSLEDFLAAKKMDSRPALACFYSGLAFREMGEAVRAVAEFQEGLRHQPLHYKCLTGAFDSLMELGRAQQAYDLSATLRTNFPVSAVRLGQFFDIAVATGHHEDLPEYYGIFQKIENRPAELVQSVAASFMAAGRHAISRRNVEKAVAFFETGTVVNGRDLRYLTLVIEELIGAGALAEAGAFFKRLPPEAVGGPEHAQLGFKIDSFTLPKDQLLERGRKIVMAGQASPELYEKIVMLMAEAGKTALAETVINRAVADHPEMRGILYRILEEHERRD